MDSIGAGGRSRLMRIGLFQTLSFIYQAAHRTAQGRDRDVERHPGETPAGEADRDSCALPGTGRGDRDDSPALDLYRGGMVCIPNRSVPMPTITKTFRDLSSSI